MIFTFKSGFWFDIFAAKYGKVGCERACKTVAGELPKADQVLFWKILNSTKSWVFAVLKRSKRTLV